MPGFPPVHGRFSGRPQHQVIGRFILFAAGCIWKAVCGMDLKSEDAEQIQHQRENRESGRAERENAIEQLRRDSSSVSLWKAVIAFAGETFKPPVGEQDRGFSSLTVSVNPAAVQGGDMRVRRWMDTAMNCGYV